MAESPKFYTGRDLGDEDPSGEEKMFRMKQQYERDQEQLRQATLGGEFDTILNERSPDRVIDESA